jgi:hypothetical protein
MVSVTLQILIYHAKFLSNLTDFAISMWSRKHQKLYATIDKTLPQLRPRIVFIKKKISLDDGIVEVT